VSYLRIEQAVTDMKLSDTPAKQDRSKDSLDAKQQQYTNLATDVSQILVRELEEKVVDLWKSLVQARQLVSDQEEELTEQIAAIAELEAKLQSATESESLSLLQKLTSAQEKEEMLEGRLADWRYYLQQQQAVYEYYNNLLQEQKKNLATDGNKPPASPETLRSQPETQQNMILYSAMKAPRELVNLSTLKTPLESNFIKGNNLLRSLPKSRIALIAGLVLLIAGSGGLSLYSLLQARTNAASQPDSDSVPTSIVPQAVAARGRIEPQGEVIRIAPTGKERRIAQLLVKQGDVVKAGQAIAILDDRDRLQAELEQAQEQVRVKQSRLAQVQAGAKTGEIGAQQSTIQRLQAQWQGDLATQQATLQRLEAQVEGEIAVQRATIRKLEAELRNAQAEYQRYQQLNKEGAIAASTYDTKGTILETSRQQLLEATTNLKRIERTGRQQVNEARSAYERIERTGRQQINEAQATLAKIAEVRPVDVQAAQREVDAAIAAVKKARADLDLAYVRSPQAGQVLKVHSRAGEVVGNEGILDLGQTQQMAVVAEVYESDVQRVKQGQKASIASDAFPGEVTGKVKEIGLQIYKNDVLDTDPTAAADARIVEVKILLDPDSSAKVRGFTNLEVTVAIHPTSP
jgi:HlyD family secretion protein